jgi:hypothetical protein
MTPLFREILTLLMIRGLNVEDWAEIRRLNRAGGDGDQGYRWAVGDFAEYGA